MTTKEELQALLERVEKATGPDREIDLSLFKMECPEYAGDEWREYAGGVRHRNDGSDMREPPKVRFAYYTSSIDAALALVGMVLPGWVCENIGQDAAGRLGEMRGMGWTAEFSNGLDTHQGQAPTLPLSILAALLKALIAQKETE